MSLLDQELALLTRLVEAAEKIAAAATLMANPAYVYQEKADVHTKWDPLTPQPAPVHKLSPGGTYIDIPGNGFVARCTCGWITPPLPTPNVALHWFRNHLAANPGPIPL